jgi:thioredoxin-dependent peroxiredoxin
MSRSVLGSFVVLTLALAPHTAVAGFTPELYVGDTAPDVELLDQDGNPLRLSSLWGGGAVVVFFYPKDFTPVCTQEALDFRDAMAELERNGVAIVGVSIDTVGSHKRFADRNDLAYPLLSDVHARMAGLFRVQETHQGFALARRSTFLIDQGGEIIRIWDPADPRAHVPEVLEESRRLADAASRAEIQVRK